jgi:hypothetical protein
MNLNFRSDDKSELLAMAESLAQANGHLMVELSAMRQELARLRKSRALAAMRGDIRQIERAYMDAKFLGALHIAGLSTGRREIDLHGLSRWRHENALSILRLGRIYGKRGWRTVEPAAVAAGIERGGAAALNNPERWRHRLPTYRTVSKQLAKVG